MGLGKAPANKGLFDSGSSLSLSVLIGVRMEGNTHPNVTHMEGAAPVFTANRLITSVFTSGAQGDADD